MCAVHLYAAATAPAHSCLCQLLACALAADNHCCIDIQHVWCAAQLAQALSKVAQDGKQVWMLHVADATLPARCTDREGACSSQVVRMWAHGYRAGCRKVWVQHKPKLLLFAVAVNATIPTVKEPAAASRHHRPLALSFAQPCQPIKPQQPQLLHNHIIIPEPKPLNPSPKPQPQPQHQSPSPTPTEGQVLTGTRPSRSWQWQGSGQRRWLGTGGAQSAAAAAAFGSSSWQPITHGNSSLYLQG